jgi:hypothetical protein
MLSSQLHDGRTRLTADGSFKSEHGACKLSRLSDRYGVSIWHNAQSTTATAFTSGPQVKKSGHPTAIGDHVGAREDPNFRKAGRNDF